MPTEFKLPELGENVQSGDVLRILVKVGDTIARDQPVVELETDKATIEVPSSVGGRVVDLKVKTGEKVKVGQVILTVEEAASPQAAAAATPAPSTPETPSSSPDAAAAAKPDRTRAVEQAAEPSDEPSDDDEDEDEASAVPEAPAPRARRGEVVEMARPPRPQADSASGAPSSARPAAPAAPSTRRLARELGVDIDAVGGSGPEGRISVDDVKAHAKKLLSRGGTDRAPAGGPLPDFSRWGAVERKPLRGVRRKTAQHLAHAWATIPHVTQYDRADITTLEATRQKYAKQVEAAGGALTLTAIATKVIAAALKVFPEFNASIDMANEELIEKKYVHVGVAVDTERGLLVPVIRDADQKNLVAISRELTDLSARAREGKLTLEEMQGGSISISNLGGIGGTAFSPIVNAPEVAILGIARASMQPVFIDGQFQPRLLLPLSLSYDHRVIDGADAVRFLRWVIEALEQPLVISLFG